MSIRVLSSWALALAWLAGSSSSAWSQSAPPVRAGENGVAPEAVVVAAGCLMRQTADAAGPAAGHESEIAHGLSLTKATLISGAAERESTGAPSAVPGSRPSGAGTETVVPPRRPATTPTSTDDRAFWIAGTRAAELSRYIGKHVQVTGTLLQQQTDQRSTATSSVGTAGTRPGDTRTTAEQPGTRAESGASRVAHPSAVTQTINVTSFRVDEGICP